MTRKFSDDEEAGLAAIGRIDVLAKDSTGPLPEHVTEAIVHGTAMVCVHLEGPYEARNSLHKGLLALAGNLYRVGYLAGTKDTEARCGVGHG